MSKEAIIVRGARQHNLKNIDVVIPRDKLVVITGVSGSGKTSLALDTIYAEGQRRYVESLSAYARQFLGQMDKPDVDYIEGLSPAICIDQRAGGRNPRSTVATVTEIYDYMRLLWARVGLPHCPRCGRPIAQQTIEQMVDRVMTLPEGTRILVLAPLVRGRKGEHHKVFEDIRKAGYVRVRVDGEVMGLDEPIELDKYRQHTIEAVVDRLTVRPGAEVRLADSLETALELGGGVVLADVIGGQEILFSESFACPVCGLSLEELTPRMFSFNSPYGACPACDGLGTDMKIDPDLVIPDRRKSIEDGAVVPWAGGAGGYYHQLLESVAAHFGFPTDVPLDELDPRFVDIILYGAPGERIRFRYENKYGRVRTRTIRFQGVIHYLERQYRETTSDAVRMEIEEYMSRHACPECGGTRLRKESLAVTVGGKSIAEVTALPVREALAFFESLRLTEREELIARQILKEIRERLRFMVEVGLGYLTLARSAGTLSGGEAQRIRLATQIGSSLVGVLYILDEPSIGLHQRDNARLIATLKRLRDIGNTVIVVEHDEETIRSADYVVDMGPGAGSEGGRVVAAGTPAEVAEVPESVTGRYLSGRARIEVPEVRRRPAGPALRVRGAREHNLKNIDVSIPRDRLVVITGLSGSGKSSLAFDTLFAEGQRRYVESLSAYARQFLGQMDKPDVDYIEGLSPAISIDQKTTSHNPRSTV
ncbi:MAG TPA: excinuclease ABC subunit A, partial [Clostridiales bacterium]|nr:excinuclease ABC subunit A [Clostridiales bacterium]